MKLDFRDYLNSKDDPEHSLCNQVGGQDELVFDGNSFVIDDGKLTFIASDVFDNSYPLLILGVSVPRSRPQKRTR